MRECISATEQTRGWQGGDAVFSALFGKVSYEFRTCAKAIVVIMIGAIHVNNTSTNLSYSGAYRRRFNALKRNQDQGAKSRDIKGLSVSD